ncbi:hypothetical protein [Oceanisphaera sp. IT1-181]|uniref:hypothetical protein n=1 Tax=Oceanisphaera sp. IT1-181 TaxID=3081199 RepID=UPI0029CA89CE|nr:hypothetical protein [Oceanisphaera sp. IT1-181]
MNNPQYKLKPHRQVGRRQPLPRRYCTLVALWLVFLLPVGLAWLTLQQGWFTTGVNSHGQWVTGQVAADSQWRLIVPQAANCAPCPQAEPVLAQLILALGRDGSRVRQLVMPATVELEVGFVYIADPPGTLIMRYLLYGQPPQVSLQLELQPQGLLQEDLSQKDQVMAKALLSDVRRLLTYSRSG